MRKTIVSLTDRQMETLAIHAKEIGISKSELLRRIMDKYLGSGKKLIKPEDKPEEKPEEVPG